MGEITWREITWKDVYRYLVRTKQIYWDLLFFLPIVLVIFCFTVHAFWTGLMDKEPRIGEFLLGYLSGAIIIIVHETHLLIKYKTGGLYKCVVCGEVLLREPFTPDVSPETRCVRCGVEAKSKL
jgi:DNA-directed RNA polymerase subunit RPC12/RpoP